MPPRRGYSLCISYDDVGGDLRMKRDRTVGTEEVIITVQFSTVHHMIKSIILTWNSSAIDPGFSDDPSRLT